MYDSVPENLQKMFNVLRSDEERFWTVDQLAEACGVTPPTVRNNHQILMSMDGVQCESVGQTTAYWHDNSAVSSVEKLVKTISEKCSIDNPFLTLQELADMAYLSDQTVRNHRSELINRPSINSKRVDRTVIYWHDEIHNMGLKDD